MNYYRRYVGDYLRDTARLSMLEHGAYTLLLDYYYADEKPLPLDHHELYLMVRAMRPEDRKAVDKVLAQFFTQEPDGYHQKRVDHEIGVSQTARGNGKGGGRPRTGHKTGNETGSITDPETGEITGSGTGEGGGSGHPPTTNLQPPAASHQPLPANRQGKTKARFAPPEWVPPEPWAAFEAMRQRIRKPMTDRAKELVIIELDKLRGQGHDPAGVLEQSVRKSWQDVYPIGRASGTGSRELENWSPPG